MNTKGIIKVLNLTDGDVLTLEKATDRMEFEALPGFVPGARCFVDMCSQDGCTCNASGYCSSDSQCTNCTDACNVDISTIFHQPCDCDGPYIPHSQCHPYHK